MRRSIVALATLALFALSLLPSLAATGTLSQSKKAASAVCPVLHVKVPDVSKAPKSVYKGKTYYFCCKDCKAKFDKNPEKYIKPAGKKKAVSAVCPVMGTKIPDVCRAAGKSVYKGKTYYFCCPGCKPEFEKNPEKYVKKQPAKH